MRMVHFVDTNVVGDHISEAQRMYRAISIGLSLGLQKLGMGHVKALKEKPAMTGEGLAWHSWCLMRSALQPICEPICQFEVAG